MPSRWLRATRPAVLAAACLAGSLPLAAQTQPAPVAACAACHGAGGNSPTQSIPSIAGQPRTFLENQLVLIREGLRDVPSMKAVMGGLSDAEIVAVAKHFSAQTVVPAAMAPDEALRQRGASVAQRALCGTCHLPGYVGQGQVPRLAGQHGAYLLTTMKMYRDRPDPGRDTAMSAALYGLTDADLAGLAHYLATTP
jgi:cytochrome c553